MFVCFAGYDPMVVDRGLQYDSMQVGQIGFQCTMVPIRNLGWFHKQWLPTLHVRKSDRPLESKLHLQRIEQMKCRDVMLSKSKVLEATFENRRIDKEIGKDDDQGSLANRFSDLIENSW